MNNSLGQVKWKGIIQLADMLLALPVESTYDSAFQLSPLQHSSWSVLARTLEGLGPKQSSKAELFEAYTILSLKIQANVVFYSNCSF